MIKELICSVIASTTVNTTHTINTGELWIKTKEPMIVKRCHWLITVEREQFTLMKAKYEVDTSRPLRRVKLL